MKFDPVIHLDPYGPARFATLEGGFIVWRRGTGGNVELINLQVSPESRRKGAGRRLLQRMLAELKKNPPYATVFGFSREVNREAHDFYREMGFTLSRVDGVYADGSAIVFSALYSELCQKHIGG